MKKFLFAAMAMLALQANFALATKPQQPPNPADYTITVHVIFAHFAGADAYAGHQQLDVVIDGQEVTLRSETGTGVLTPGDYKARTIVPKNSVFLPPVRNQNGFDVWRMYEMLMPDGTLRNFDVVGLGPKDAGGPPSTN